MTNDMPRRAETNDVRASARGKPAGAILFVLGAALLLGLAVVLFGISPLGLLGF